MVLLEIHTCCIHQKMRGGNSERGRGGLLKIPRGDRNGVGEDKVTVTSGLHAQAERTNKQTNRGERATSGGGLDQDPKSDDVAHSRGRPVITQLATEGMLCRKLRGEGENCSDVSVFLEGGRVGFKTEMMFMRERDVGSKYREATQTGGVQPKRP